MTMSTHISLSHSCLDESLISSYVRDPSAGAICTFVGTTRDNFGGKRVVKLWYEAYESLAMKEMHRIAQEAREKRDEQDAGVIGIAMVHRLGDVPVGETSIVIAVSSAHRKKSFEVCEWILEKVKESVPIWKQEYYSDGSDITASDGSTGGLTRSIDPLWKENFPSS